MGAEVAASLRCTAASSLAAVLLAVCPAAAAGEPGWKLTEQDENPTIFAIAEPVSTNLNVKAVVLSCEEVDGQKVLQLQIYPSNRRPLLPSGARRSEMKPDPRAEIVIDGHIHPVTPLFGGDFALLSDRAEADPPGLSATVVEAMEAGHTMLLRFDIVGEPEGQPPEFDGEATIDLRAGQGSTAIAAVRRGCAK